MLLSSKFIRLLVVSLITIFSTATSLSAQDSGWWAYDSSTNTLTLSGSVDWSLIKKYYSETTVNVIFSGVYTTSIPSRAFKEFSKLTAIDIPGVVTSIGDSAFAGCTSLTSITLPASLTSIGMEAFEGCTSLKSVEILSNGTPDNKHIIYLSNSTDKASNGYGVFPCHQATLIYDPETTWIGDNDTQNLCYYFDEFITRNSTNSSR